MMEVLANSSMVIILQNKNISNQHSLHLKRIQCYVLIISQ